MNYQLLEYSCPECGMLLKETVKGSFHNRREFIRQYLLDIKETLQRTIVSRAFTIHQLVVVTLFNFSSAQNAVLQSGNFIANDLGGPMAGKTVSDLIDAMKNNSTYVNFHTEQNPDGEIRGQMMSTE